MGQGVLQVRRAGGREGETREKSVVFVGQGFLWLLPLLDSWAGGQCCRRGGHGCKCLVFGE